MGADIAYMKTKAYRMGVGTKWTCTVIRFLHLGSSSMALTVSTLGKIKEAQRNPQSIY